MRLLDDEINAWQAITGQVIEDGMKNNTLPPLPTDFDGKTYALLRGKEVYYGMTSREVRSKVYALIEIVTNKLNVSISCR